MTGPALGASSTDSVIQVLIWGGVLLLAVIVLFGAVWYYRRRWLTRSELTGGTPWTLDDLRRMREAGDITEEEYRALRAALVAAYRGGQTEDDVVWTPADGLGEVQGPADKNAPDFDLRNGPEG